MLEYSENNRDALIAILRQNVPKYFSESDVDDFQKYLCEKQWDGHDVFMDGKEKIIGCASYYLKSPSVVGLAWMFFSPYQIGHRRILHDLEEYLESIRVRIGVLGSKLTFSLNTTPRVARVLRRIGFVSVKTVKDGYSPGYDRVSMER